MTGSRRADRLIFATLALLIVAGGHRLRVYHTVAGATVDAVVVAADGTQRAVPLPLELRRAGAAGPPLDEVVAHAEGRIRTHAAGVVAGLGVGEAVVYTLRFGENSPELPGRRVYRFVAAPAPGPGVIP